MNILFKDIIYFVMIFYIFNNDTIDYKISINDNESISLR